MAQIHPTAIIDDSVTLGRDVRIGPYCCVTGEVTLGDNVVLESHVVVTGRTSIGSETHIYPFASIGHVPQDLKFDNEDVVLEIGSRNRIREHVTMNPGTEGGGGVTRVGDDGLFMMGAHVAHDCIVGDNVILANNATLGGHVVLGDFAILGGLVGVHQFCRIGEHAFVGAGGLIVEDVIPYGTATGNRAVLSGLNLVGLKRRNFARDEINALRAAYKELFLGEDDALAVRMEAVAAKYADSNTVQTVIAFMRLDNSRGFCAPARAASRS